MEQVQESLRPAASFLVENTTNESQRLALFAGHYNTDEIVLDKDGKAIIVHCDPSALEAAGYRCDQVADDFNADVVSRRDGSSKYPIKFTANSKRTRAVDFLNYVKYSGLKVCKMKITDLSSDTEHDQFNQELEVSKSSIGSKGGSDYIQLSTYINPKNFKTNVLEVDLEEENLLLDETTVVIIDVVPNAKFKIDYILG